MKKIFLLVVPLLFLGALSVKAESVPEVTGLEITKRTMHSITVSWDAVDNADSYHIRVTKPSHRAVKTKDTTKTTTKIKHLKKGKNYIVKVRAEIENEVGPYCEPEPVKTEGDVNSITLSTCVEATCIDDDDDYETENVCWEVDGYSDLGFKLVWSKNSAPEYPTRSGDYYQYCSDPETEEGTITAYDGTGTYYVRVCEYLGGACGVYSNEIEVEL